MAENKNTRIADGGRRRRQSMSPQRLAAVIGGGALAAYGIAQKSPMGAALATSGGAVAIFAGIRKPEAETDSKELVRRVA